MKVRNHFLPAVGAALALFCTVANALDFADTLGRAQRGECGAAHNVGVAYVTGNGVEKNETEARTWFLRAARLGSHSAMYSLGIVYRFGQGVEVDPVESAAWYALAATYIAQNDDEWVVPRAKIAMYARTAAEAENKLTEDERKQVQSRIPDLQREIKSATSCG